MIFCLLYNIINYYSLGDELIDYCENEKDLGIHLNGTHADVLCSKVNQRFGILKWTYHFIKNKNRKRALFLTMVRSLFEHFPHDLFLNKLESVRKRALKWILNYYYSESAISYGSNYHMFHMHCKQFNILPTKFIFDSHNLKMFPFIVYGYSCVKLPDYIKPFEGSRLRNCHIDAKCYVSTVQASRSASYRNFEYMSKGVLSNTFFYRVHLSWN